MVSILYVKNVAIKRTKINNPFLVFLLTTKKGDYYLWQIQNYYIAKYANVL